MKKTIIIFALLFSIITNQAYAKDNILDKIQKKNNKINSGASFVNKKPKDISNIEKNSNLPENINNSIKVSDTNTFELDKNLKAPLSTIINYTLGEDEAKNIEKKFDEIINDKENNKYTEISNLILNYDNKINANRNIIISKIKKLSTGEKEDLLNSVDILLNMAQQYTTISSNTKKATFDIMKSVNKNEDVKDTVIILNNKMANINYHRTKRITNFAQNIKMIVSLSGYTKKYTINNKPQN